MMSFLAPLLLWGTLLGSVPLIIHLLNRRRFRRVEWAPMRLLKLTIKRNRRRIQIEQLLLLLLRIAIPIVLFLMFARPILNATGLEGWAGLGGRTSRVVLVDDSLSMGFSTEGPPAFPRAREVAAALLSDANPQDRCSLVTTSMPTVPVLSEVEGSRRDELAGAALGLTQTETHASWPTVLDGLDAVLEACTFPKPQVTIITDLRRSGWDEGVSSIARRWEDRGVNLRIVDVGEEAGANLAVLALEPVDRTILADTESRWEATIRNDSPRSLDGLSAIVRVDDAPTEITLPEIPPGESARVPLTVRFPGPGPHNLSIELPNDALPGDNRRWVAVSVKDSLRIRLVDGEPSSEPFGGEVDYLAAPLSIGVGEADAWRVEVAQEEDFLSDRLEPPDVLVLANVAAPTAEQADRLSRLVRKGMGLMIFTGGRIDVGLYDDLLNNEDGPLLPARMRSITDQEIRGLVVEPVRPSPLEKLLDLRASALERVVVRQIMTVEESAEGEASGEVRVLARWNDPARSPAILERVVGEGRVLLWTTTADRDGSDWPIEPSFVLAIREAVRGTARPTSLEATVTAGDPLRRVVPTDSQLDDIRLFPPNDGEPIALSAVPIAQDDSEAGAAVAIDVADTRRTGLYRIAWEEGPLGLQEALYASNADPRESQLDRIGAEELKGLLRPLDVDVASARLDETMGSPTGRELWRPIAAILFSMMLFEPFLAAWVGRSR